MRGVAIILLLLGISFALTNIAIVTDDSISYANDVVSKLSPYFNVTVYYATSSIPLSVLQKV